MMTVVLNCIRARDQNVITEIALHLWTNVIPGSHNTQLLLFCSNVSFPFCLSLCSYCIAVYIRQFPGRYYTCCKYTPVNVMEAGKLILMGTSTMCVSLIQLVYPLG